MRSGPGRARLCDLPGCPEKWPCSVHGTRRVGDYEHLGRHAGQFALTGRPHADGDVVLDMVHCGACGFALCCCKQLVRKQFACGFTTREFVWDMALRPGWTTDGESYFNDAIGLMVARTASGKWRILGNASAWPQGYAHKFQWSAPASAMRLAEILASNRAREALLP